MLGCDSHTGEHGAFAPRMTLKTDVFATELDSVCEQERILSEDR